MYTPETDAPIANQHLHLTGALSLAYLRDAAERSGLILNDYEPLQQKKFDDPEVWALAKELTSTKAGLEDAIKHVVDAQVHDGVSTVELTFNPYGMLRRGMTPFDIADAAVRGAEYASREGAHLLVRPGVNRKDGPQTINDVYAVYREIPESITAGIDLNGDERRYATAPFVDGFTQLSDQGVPVAIHAGEFVDQAESLRAALRARPARIGHAVAAITDYRLFDALRESGATVEVALTSNLALGAVASIEQHPVAEFARHGVPVVFGTDDPVFFNNTMADEFTLLQSAGVRLEDVRKGKTA